MGDLRLKSFVHYGEFLIKKVSRFEEIAGENVILAHRLMKNTVSQSEYMLFTDSVKEICDLKYLGEIDKRVENCDGLGKVPVSVFYPNTPDTMNPEVQNMGRIKKFRKMHKYFKISKTRGSLEEKVFSV